MPLHPTTGVAAVWLLACCLSPLHAAEPLSSAETALLPELTPALARECLETRSAIAPYLPGLAALQARPGSGADPAWELLACLTSRSAAFFALLDRQALHGQPLVPDLSGTTFQAEARARLTARLSANLQAIVAFLDRAERPAREVDRLCTSIKESQQTFLDGDTAFPFRVEMRELSPSPFSPTADLEFCLAYRAVPGLELRARGLSFRHENGRAVPVFDPGRVHLTGSLEELFGRKEWRFGKDGLLGGLPVRFERVRFLGWDRGAALRADAVIDLGPILGVRGEGLLTVRAEVELRPGSERALAWTGKFTGALPASVPLGPTGLVLEGGSVELDRTAGKVTVRTCLKTATGGPGGLSLLATLEARRPGEGPAVIALTADLVLGRVGQKLGRVQGSLSSGRVGGRLLVLPPGDAEALQEMGECDFVLDGSGLQAELRGRFFRSVAGQFRLRLNPGGAATFSAVGKVALLGGEVAGELEVRCEQGWSNPHLLARLSVEVSLRGRAVRTEVEVRATGAGVRVQARAGEEGKAIHFRMPRLDFSLRKELKARLCRGGDVGGERG